MHSGSVGAPSAWLPAGRLRSFDSENPNLAYVDVGFDQNDAQQGESFENILNVFCDRMASCW